MRKILVPLCMTLSILLCSCSCSTKKQDKQATIQSVKIGCAQEYNNKQTSEFIGKVVAKQDVNIAFRIAGTLERIPVKVGQYIRKGDIIALMDSRDYKTQLSATKAEYRQIKAEATRVIELYNRKSVPENDYDKAVAGIERITAKLDAHSNALSDCSLKSPMNGSIQSIKFNEGETIGAGMPVISMISIDGFEIEIFVPASYYSSIQESDSYYGEIEEVEYPLEFISISPKSNANGLYSVKLKIKNLNSKKIAAGMSSKVKVIDSSDFSSLVSIPVTSIFERDGSSYVWIYSDKTNKVSLSKIEVVELLHSGTILVKSGVVKGDKIVVAGVNSIDESSLLREIPNISKSNIGGLK